MKRHPYNDLPDYSFWKRSLVDIPIPDVDLITDSSLNISRTDKIATAGSCFAQHIAKYLKNSGYNYFVTEKPHSMISGELAIEYNYGTFTARYGNIYTARQLLQLFKRAYGTFIPSDKFWKSDNGASFIDPYRPQIQPNGFSSIQEFDQDQKQHFACVRDCFEKLDYFVFTLGLTESWINKEDGAVYPICPGVEGGIFDSKKHVFKNFTVEEVTSDMIKFIDLLRGVNPKSKIIITVSPVPLKATFENRHVLVSTTYSKSVLRVSCEQIINLRKDIIYFPSYEIITGNYTRGKYFSPDLRSINEEGINHVMSLFLKHYTDGVREDKSIMTEDIADNHIEKTEKIMDIICDEEALDKDD